MIFEYLSGTERVMARTGRVVSQESREKMRTSLLGHPVSDETRQKISESAKRRYAKARAA
jgi:hypothetical protein